MTLTADAPTSTDRDPRDPVLRLENLLDPGSLTLLFDRDNSGVVAARGTITTFSVITPLQYQGQEETDDYVQATILLDGTHSTLGMQRIPDLPIADVHTGLRVEAVWRPEAERKLSGGAAWLS